MYAFHSGKPITGLAGITGRTAGFSLGVNFRPEPVFHQAGFSVGVNNFCAVLSLPKFVEQK
jgi:hypothetical protein